MKSCRSERNRFNSGKTCRESRDLSPASAPARKFNRQYEWDQFNRMTMVKNGSGTPLVGFEYGGTGEHTIQQAHAPGTTYELLFQQVSVNPLTLNAPKAHLNLERGHRPQLNAAAGCPDEPLAILESGIEKYIYYLHDGLGSVTALTDADGNLIGDYNYGAFGDDRRNTVAIENRYRYTSREFVEPNLYYYRARHMRPDLGRFISMDPLKTINGTNMFIYVGNSPKMWIDPFGLLFDMNCVPIWDHTTGEVIIPCDDLPPPPPSTDSNGNRIGSGGAKDQDWKCSRPFGGANISPCHKICCIEHDKCYKKHGCNESSWRYSFFGGSKPCWICNRVVTGCFAIAAINPACYVCAIFPETPDGPGPGPYPGGPGGPQWN